MTPEDQKLLAGDSRRAAVLIRHFTSGNMDGINAVLQEAAEANRVTPLILSVMDLYTGLLAPLIERPSFNKGLGDFISAALAAENKSS